MKKIITERTINCLYFSIKRNNILILNRKKIYRQNEQFLPSTTKRFIIGNYIHLKFINYNEDL